MENKIFISGLELAPGKYYRIDDEIHQLKEFKMTANVYKKTEELYNATFIKKGRYIVAPEVVLNSKELLNLIYQQKIKKIVITEGFVKEELTQTIGKDLFAKVYTPYDTGTLRPNNVVKIIDSTKKLPTKVQFNDKKKAVTLIFDNKVTIVKTSEDDTYDRKYGFLMAYFQAKSGLSKTKANKYLKEIVEAK